MTRNISNNTAFLACRVPAYSVECRRLGGDLKKNWTKIAIVLGPLIVIASVFWEFARMQPDYKFLIEPWSMRGTEMIHGDVFLTVGVLLLVAGIATAWEQATKPLWSSLIVLYIVLATVGVAVVYADKDISFTFNPVWSGILSLLLGSGVALSLRSLFGGRLRIFKRGLPVFAVAFLALYGLFAASVMNTTVTMTTWVLLAIVMVALAAMTLTIRPVDMAANRMLVLGTVAVWATITASAGAMRSTLLTTQLDINGISAQYKDTQAAGGWWVAGLGVTIAFVGAVGLWAKRRDFVAAIARAKKQRAAADKSAQEIEDAMKTYEAEVAARETTST